MVGPRRLRRGTVRRGGRGEVVLIEQRDFLGGNPGRGELCRPELRAVTCAAADPADDRSGHRPPLVEVRLRHRARRGSGRARYVSS